jgi:hypothetical protein
VVVNHGNDRPHRHAGDPGASERISEIVGRTLQLVNRAGADEKTGTDRNTF